jgi:hypothetical protein
MVDNGMKSFTPLTPRVAPLIQTLIGNDVLALKGHTMPGASFGNACNTTAITWSSNTMTITPASVQPTVLSPDRLQLAFDVATRINYGMASHTCAEVDGASCPSCQVPTRSIDIE